MPSTQITRQDLIEHFKDGSIHALKQYSDAQLHEREDLLHLAVQYAPMSVIKYLVEEKKVPLFHDADGNDDFAFNHIKHRSGRHKDSAEVYSLLMENMKQRNPTWASLDSPTKSSLDSVVDDPYITTNQKKDIMLGLLEAGANLNKNHKEGYPSTVLGRALLKKDDDLARFLIDAGANPHLPEPAIGKTSLDFDSTSTTRNYVAQMQNPIAVNREVAMKGLLENIKANNIDEIEMHLERPEFRRLTVGGKNLYEMAQERVPSMSGEMQELLKYNVAPNIKDENSPVNRMLSIREKSFVQHGRSNSLNM